jgi:hypothetical protein
MTSLLPLKVRKGMVDINRKADKKSCNMPKLEDFKYIFKNIWNSSFCVIFALIKN